MGYTTEFSGQISISPPLNNEEIAFLKKFSNTRRMDRHNGPYFVDGTGFMGQDHDPDVIDHNTPPSGQPGLWCNWEPTATGDALEWNGTEKFYHADAWMAYVIDHFLKPGCGAASTLPFLQANHVCNGIIKAQGEERSDRWILQVTDNIVSVKDDAPKRRRAG